MAVGEGEVNATDRLINTARALGSTTIDLSGNDLTEIPKEVLELKQLEFLYLQGNCISSIPDDLFERLTCLRWLDLRNNRLSELPSVVGEHRNLKNLLLEGNNIKMLPLELGFTKSLSGLNLTGNPLEFPTPQVIERGTQEVLKFLREHYLERLKDKGETHLRERSDSSSSDELSEEAPEQSSVTKRAGHKPRWRTNSQGTALEGPVNVPAAFHPPPSRSDRIRLEYDKQRMALQSSGALSADVRSRGWSGSSVPSSSKKKHSSKSASASSSTALRFQYDAAAPTFPDYESNIAQQHEMAINAALNEKEALIFQRRKDKQALDSWRDHTKRLRQQKQRLAAIKGRPAVDVKAPYGTEQSSEEEKEKQPPGYAKTLKEILDSKDKGAPRRALLDRELEARIKIHMGKLQDHRRKAYNNIQEELESARRNLEIAHQFQRDLGSRRELEYRLRAFTGDDNSTSSNKIQEISHKEPQS